MRSLIRQATTILLLGWLATGVASAAEKTYEKPSAFLTRHFGGIPKTRVLSLSGTQQKQLAGILGHHYRATRSPLLGGGRQNRMDSR